MTTDRDRVEAAIAGYWDTPYWADNDATWVAVERRRMSRALAAADALAPPPVPLDRAAVARVVLGALNYNVGYTNSLAVADAVLALLPAAPPPVPEDVRRAIIREVEAYAEAYDDGRIGLRAYQACSKVRSLLATPAPPADTGDEVERLIRERDAARSQREWTKDKWDEDWKKFAATYDMLKGRAETAEARLARAREALERARPFVQDAGCDEDPDAACGSCDALKLIARALADSEPAGRAALAAEGE